MSRKVFVSSDMSVDERLLDVAEQDSQAALMWPWFLTVFDDWGRAEANAKRLKVSIFPGIPSISYEDVERAITLYQSVGLLQLYEVDGKRYTAFLDWFELQRPQFVRPSKYPDPPVSCEAVKKYLQKCHSWPIRPATPWLKYRRLVFERDGFRCVYCGSTERLGLDHVIPRSRGGADTPDNLVTACFPCNRRKSSRTPEEANMKIWGWRDNE